MLEVHNTLPKCQRCYYQYLGLSSGIFRVQTQLSYPSRKLSKRQPVIGCGGMPSPTAKYIQGACIHPGWGISPTPMIGCPLWQLLGGIAQAGSESWLNMPNKLIHVSITGIPQKITTYRKQVMCTYYILICVKLFMASFLFGQFCNIDLFSH